MIEWKKVTKCPRCGDRLMIHKFMNFSYDYPVVRGCKMSKRRTRGEIGSMDCLNMSCSNCGAYWDDTKITLDSDETVWVKGDGEL